MDRIENVSRYIKKRIGHVFEKYLERYTNEKM